MSDIDDNVPMPTSGEGWDSIPEVTAPPKRGRGRPPKGATASAEAPEAPAPAKRTRKATGKAPSQAEALERALAFVAPASTDSETMPVAAHVNLTNCMAVVYNGQIACGHPIEEVLHVAPHLDKLRAALKKTGNKLILTETGNMQLSLQGQRLRATIPCLDPSELVQMQPDAPVITGEFDVLKEAFKACGSMANEKAERMIEASILLQPNVCSATNGAMIVQYWHGLTQLPPDVVLPKLFTQAIAAIPYKITALGGTWDAERGIMSSFTVWFENNSWYKTQTYFDRWPDLANILDIPSAPTPVPEGFFEGFASISEFLQEGQAVFCKPGWISSHFAGQEMDCGAVFEVPELNTDKVLNAELVKKMANFAQVIDFNTHLDKIVFFGGQIRGVLMAMNK